MVHESHMKGKKIPANDIKMIYNLFTANIAIAKHYVRLHWLTAGGHTYCCVSIQMYNILRLVAKSLDIFINIGRNKLYSPSINTQTERREIRCTITTHAYAHLYI